MASINNILLTADNEPIKKYAKTIPSKLSGNRLDPMTGHVMPFVLESNKDGRFDYEADVIEIYSAKEDKFFIQANRNFIKEGLLKLFDGSPTQVPQENILSDEDVESIATIRTIPALIKRLSEITSTVAVNRVLETAKAVGRPATIISTIENRIKELKS